MYIFYINVHMYISLYAKAPQMTFPGRYGRHGADPLRSAHGNRGAPGKECLNQKPSNVGYRHVIYSW